MFEFRYIQILVNLWPHMTQGCFGNTSVSFRRPFDLYVVERCFYPGTLNPESVDQRISGSDSGLWCCGCGFGSCAVP